MPYGPHREALELRMLSRDLVAVSHRLDELYANASPELRSWLVDNAALHSINADTARALARKADELDPPLMAVPISSPRLEAAE